MGFRFRKSKKLFPGVNVTLSKSGLSTSLGVKGARVTLGKKGITQTVGIPGAGISHTSSSGGSKKGRKKVTEAAQLMETDETVETASGLPKATPLQAVISIIVIIVSAYIVIKVLF